MIIMLSHPHPLLPPIKPPLPQPLLPHPPQQNKSNKINKMLLLLPQELTSQPQFEPQFVADKSLMLKASKFCLHLIICGTACIVYGYFYKIFEKL